MRVLIVDDDPNTIELIKNTMNWDKMGVTEILCSYNGIHAKQMLQSKEPEIVLCDIEMPLCNGMEVLKYIYENNIVLEFIFLTCHDSFEYAKKAIEFNAMGYLTKPFKPEEVTAVIMKAIVKVNNRTSHNELVQKEYIWKKNQDIMGNSLLWAIFQKTVPNDKEKMKNVINIRNINFDVNEKVYLVYAGINTRKLNTKEYSEADFFYILRHLTLELINNQFDYKNAVEYTLEPYDVLLLVVRESEATKDLLMERCEKLVSVSKSYMDTNVVCMVGDLIGCEELADTKKEMDVRFQQEASYSRKVLNYSDISNNTELESGGINYERILKSLRNKEKVSLVNYIRDFCEDSMKAGTLNSYKMNLIHHDLLQIFYGYLQEHNIQADKLLHDRIAIQMNMAAEYSIFDMIKYINYMFDRISDIINEVQQTSTIVAKAQKYIQQHFTEDIDRNDVANSVFLTPNYLSKLFNKETGLTIRDYINQLRIDEAKKFLHATSKAISTIAMDVGFENVSYFSTVFKKYSGCNPDAWRKI
jgi:two-component system, response regulator YesN